MHPQFRSLIFLLSVSTAPSLAYESIGSVKNLRPVVPGTALLYRAASLDSLSRDDARTLLDGSALGGDNGESRGEIRPLAAVIDLRNSDEIRRGERDRTDGATHFYSQLRVRGVDDDGGSDLGPRLIHEPILGDVDSFWDEAISRMPPASRVRATVETVWNGGALDRAAARHLEDGGLAMLYTVMLVTAPSRLGRALRACAEESKRGPVIFHCQKGKDRTGVLAMLIQICLGSSEKDIIEAYRLSGSLLGEEDGNARMMGTDGNSKNSGGGMVNWSYFRGSPSSAMADTLQWIREQHGSVEGYLDSSASFGAEERGVLRDIICADLAL